MTKEELTVWALANGWRVIAGHPSLTKPGAPNDPIVRLVLKATVVNLEVRKPAGKWEKVADESYAHVVQGSEDEPPRGLGFEKVPKHHVADAAKSPRDGTWTDEWQLESISGPFSRVSAYPDDARGVASGKQYSDRPR